MKIVILYTAPSDPSRTDELDTVKQSEYVRDILNRAGHETSLLACDLDLLTLRRQLISLQPDLVFNFTEGLNGRGEFIHVPTALLETLKIPFTGVSADAIYLTSHKILAKRLLEQSKLPTPEWYDLAKLKRTPSIAPKKFIIKSLWEHSSLGIDENAIVEIDHPSLLHEKLLLKERQMGTPCFAEAFIHGREFNVSILETEKGIDVLPLAEMQFIDFGKRLSILSFKAKWDDDSFESQHTKRNFSFDPKDQPLLDHLSALSLDCWDLFQLSGYARVDFRVDQNNHPFILEINANPCLSEDAGFMASAQQKKYSPPSVISSIICAALKN